MLGRECEVSALEGALASAASGMGVSLLLEGDIGTGKSHMLRTALRLARDKDFEVISARARQPERALPGGVLHHVRDQLLSLLGGPGSGLPDPATAGAAVDTHRLIVALADRAPLLVCVDDLQWTDPDSLHWLGHLMARLEGLPIVLLCALGRDYAHLRDAEQRSSGAATLADAVSGFHQRFLLQGLNADCIGYLLARTFREPVSTDIARACHEATGGNPLLVQSLQRELRRSNTGLAELSAERVADIGSVEVAETLAARLEPWFPGVGRVLEVVAVMSPVRHCVVVAPLVGLTAEEVDDMLYTFLRRGILVKTAAGVGFSQPMIRASFLVAMPPSERARLHAETAKALHAEAAPCGEVIAHLVVAAPIGEPWACQLLIGAADSALADGDLKTARTCLERALDECGPAEQAVLLRRLGHVVLIDDPAAAIASLRSSLRLLEGTGEARVLVLLDLLQAIVLTGDIAEASRVAEGALTEFEHGDADVESRRAIGAVSGVLALMHGGGGAQPVSPEVSTDATIPWVTRLEAARSALSAQWCGRGRTEAVRWARLGLGQSAQAHVHVLPRLWLVLALFYGGEQTEAVEKCRVIVAQATAAGSKAMAALARSVLAECAFRAGRIEEAAAEARDALAYGRGRAWLGSAQARCWLGGILLESGDVGQAQELLVDDRTVSTTPDVLIPTLLFHRGRLQIEVGWTAAGLADLEECGRQLSQRGCLNPAVFPWRSEAALAHACLGDPAAANRLAREELDLAREWGAPTSIGVALRALGLLARGDQRTALLEEAVGVLREAGAPLEEARAVRDLGRELLRTGKARQARAELRAALRLAQKCGAGGLVGNLGQDLAEAGAKPRRGTEIGPASLTPAERRTALLAAQGLTNREIAKRLYVTRRTVEMHLSRVYRKLSISDRRALSVVTSAETSAVTSAETSAVTSAETSAVTSVPPSLASLRRCGRRSYGPSSPG
ncbi:BREX system ATP-binding domain-containing protein [Streptomyces sp. NPDC007983]|uniref:BREX system ATP-binding domain-containing protein n=1 Tax=Streptomyces sp. NPDC007983 TaxID=3364800 RepID=UPI0036E04872